MTKTRIAIVDDHTILRDGLKALLKEMPGMDIVMEASNGQEFIQQLEFITPDLVIMDIKMPIMNGPETIKIVREKLPQIKIIVLSMYGDEVYYNAMNAMDVDAYITKESDYDELERAISSVLKGGKYFSQRLLLNILDKKRKESNLHFTVREREILQFLCQGLSTQEIAKKLFLSDRTIEKYRSELLLRTGSPNSISLVMYAIKNGLIKI
jgi:DNA-binding NarL/FixJ family response regulator